MALNPRVVSTFDHPHREQQCDVILGDAFMMDRGLVANSSLDGVFHWIKRSNYNPSPVEASHRQDLIGIDTAYQNQAPGYPPEAPREGSETLQNERQDPRDVSDAPPLERVDAPAVATSPMY
jgi:hypothetical protein